MPGHSLPCHLMPCHVMPRVVNINLVKNMQTINKTINIGSVPLAPDTSKLRLMLLKSILSGSVLLGCFGAIIHLVNPGTNITKAATATPQATVKPEKVTTSTKPSEPPPVVVKKPQKPIVIEEGSKAWFCIKNNGGSDCLNRDRFAPNYKVIAPPKPKKTYDDYLVQYGIKESGDCGRYFNGEPNCL